MKVRLGSLVPLLLVSLLLAALAACGETAGTPPPAAPPDAPPAATAEPLSAGDRMAMEGRQRCGLSIHEGCP